MQSSEESWEQSFEEIISTIPDLFFDDQFQPPDLSPSPARSSGPGPKTSPTGPRGRVGKPAARKARPIPSKKAQATLLAADPGNFRALVQQFTGRHSEGPLLRAYKGPINLNFKQRSFYPVNQKRDLVESDGRFFPFGGKIDDSADRDRVEFDEDFGELIVSRIGGSDGDDLALTSDGGFDVSEDSFWGREMTAGADTVLSGAVDREVWGY